MFGALCLGGGGDMTPYPAGYGLTTTRDMSLSKVGYPTGISRFDIPQNPGHRVPPVYPHVILV